MNVKKVFLWSFGLLFTLGILGCAAVAGLFYWASRDLPDLERLTGYEAPQATVILARDGSIIGTLATEKRYSITLKEMSPWLPMSFLAAEDDSFYQHHGVDPVAIARAFIYNLRNKAAGGGQQGGSTITQQIIKQLLLSSERSYTRKMKEAILAYRLEHTVSKDDILQTYLNYIYLGQHSYGVEAAARTYFGKHASDITLAESAVIAGLPQAPSRYNPFRHPDAAKARQMYVLGRLRTLKWITEEQYQQAINEPLVYWSMPENRGGPPMVFRGSSPPAGGILHRGEPAHPGHRYPEERRGIRLYRGPHRAYRHGPRAAGRRGRGPAPRSGRTGQAPGLARPGQEALPCGGDRIY